MIINRYVTLAVLLVAACLFIPGVWGADEPVASISGYDEINPDTDGTRIVYEHAYSGTDHDIYLWDTTGTTLVCGDESNQLNPRVSGDTVVWQDNRNGNWDIYKWDPVNGEVVVCNAAGDQINPDIDGDMIVFEGVYSDTDHDIYYYDGIIGAICTEESSDQRNPRIAGGTVVWQDNRNGNWDIYKWDSANGTQEVAFNLYDEINPDIAFDTESVTLEYAIVWEKVYSATNHNICFWTSSSPIDDCVSYHPYLKQSPSVDIYSGVVWIFWEDNRNVATTGWDIWYTVLGSSETSLAQIPGDQKNPTSIGNEIAWEDNRNGDWDIYHWVPDPAPTVTSITPDSGIIGTTVSITNLAGTNFVGTPAVKLTKSSQPDIMATGVNRVSSTQLTCDIEIPSGAATGTWDVVVTNPDGQGGTLAEGFTFLDPAPTVTGITPDTGMNTGTVSITDLAGTGFSTGATVKLTRNGETNLTATGVSVESATQIICTLDLTGAPAAQWNVVVTNPDGQSGELLNGFTINGDYPGIYSIAPNTGEQGTTVRITALTGTGFVDGGKVKLKKAGKFIAMRDVVVKSPTKITGKFVIPAKAATGKWTVQVKNPDGWRALFPQGFTVTSPAPTVTSIQPATGKQGTTVQITALKGTGFVDGVKVKLIRPGESIPMKNVNVVKPTKITGKFEIPAKAATGKWAVQVKNPDGQTAKLAKGFTVRA